jgi:hypothetical protein
VGLRECRYTLEHPDPVSHSAIELGCCRNDRESAAGNGSTKRQRFPQPAIKREPEGSSCTGLLALKNQSAPEEHRFWELANDWLFAGVGASCTFDYFSTLNMGRRGRQEILLSNALDNHAAFAVMEAAGTGASVGVSYLFHRYGHHKLERWVATVHISLATTGAIRNYCLKTGHSLAAPSLPCQIENSNEC